MRIAAVKHAVPTAQITNDWIAERVRERSAPHHSQESLQLLERRLRKSFAASGTGIRYALAEGERAIDIVARAGQDVLEQAGIAPAQVEFLIYTGVGRGWLEPASAPAVQNALALRNATSFDVLDACASWLRALHVAQTFLQMGTYRCGMIVNCECGLYRAYADWEIRDLDMLEYRFATYTIGEAATATVLTDGGSDDFYFRFKTMAEYLGLCMLPLSGVSDFLQDGADERLVPGRFYARSRELLAQAEAALLEEFDRDPRLRDQRYDICFGHDATKKVAEIVTERLRLPGVYFGTHREFGNTVSASVPLGMSLAIEQGRLKRGDRVLVIVGSAGMTVGFAAFTY